MLECRITLNTKKQMNRITLKNLEAVVARINHMTNSPEKPYVQVDGKCVAQIGNYHLDEAYGGYALQRMDNANGGVRDVLRTGHISKRELHERMHAWIRGFEASQG